MGLGLRASGRRQIQLGMRDLLSVADPVASALPIVTLMLSYRFDSAFVGSVQLEKFNADLPRTWFAWLWFAKWGFDAWISWRENRHGVCS